MFETVRLKFGGRGFVVCGRVGGGWLVGLDFKKIENAVSGDGPVALLGTAFSFVHWLDDLAGKKTRLRLPAGSRIMETGGYKGRSRAVAKTELRRLLTKYLGVPGEFILAEYGMSELSSQAYDGARAKRLPGPFSVFRPGPARKSFPRKRARRCARRNRIASRFRSGEYPFRHGAAN